MDFGMNFVVGLILEWVHGALTDAKVSSLIDSDRRSWKEEVLSANLFSFEAEIIKKIPLCHTVQTDTLTWPFTPTGEYTVKSGYTFLQKEFQNSQPGQSDPDYLKPLWKAIWSLQVPNNRNPDLFSVVAWAIWNRRNNLRLGKVAASLDELLAQSLDRIRDFKLNNSSLATTVGFPPTRWQAPDQDTYKVNFDGALFSEANTAEERKSAASGRSKGSQPVKDRDAKRLGPGSWDGET
nr:hypothetical protein CFP56_51498 [Quercus suber]